MKTKEEFIKEFFITEPNERQANQCYNAYKVGWYERDIQASWDKIYAAIDKQKAS